MRAKGKLELSSSHINKSTNKQVKVTQNISICHQYEKTNGCFHMPFLPLSWEILCASQFPTQVSLDHPHCSARQPPAAPGSRLGQLCCREVPAGFHMHRARPAFLPCGLPLGGSFILLTELRLFSLRSARQQRRIHVLTYKPLKRSKILKVVKKRQAPWLVWLSGLSAGCEPKGHRFESQSGHMPGLQARSPVRGA